VLRTIASEHRTATVDELCRALADRTGIRVTPMTMYRYLARAGIHRQPQVHRPSQPRAQGAAPHVGAGRAVPVRYGYHQGHRDPGDPTRYPGGLTDAEWDLVADLFEQQGPGKPPKYPRRQIVDACYYVVRSGCPWRMLPKDFPPWQDVYAHFRRWTEKGLFEAMQDRLRAMWRERQGRGPEPTAAVVDSQSVKTSAQGGPKGFDAGKKVKGRKRHLVVDVLGLVLAVLVHPANIQDRDGAIPLVATAMAKCPTIKKLYLDAAYGGRCAEQFRTQYDLDVEVVRRPNKAGQWTATPMKPLSSPSPPFPILPRRWVVERTHSWVERARRLSKDYDRRLDVSAAWVWLAQSRLLLRRLTAPDTA
jgi:transposase